MGYKQSGAMVSADWVCNGALVMDRCYQCQRYVPGPKGDKHILNPPARDSRNCGEFRKVVKNETDLH